MSNTEKKVPISNIDIVTLDTTTSLHVNSNILNLFTEIAKSNGMSRSMMIRKLMVDYVKENNQSKLKI